MEREHRRLRAAGSAIVLAAIAVFLSFFAAAARRYPGGTWADPTTRGHRFWQNFLCDLEWRTALDGLPNPGAADMRVAMLAIAVGLLALWAILPTLFPRRTAAAHWVRGLGVLGGVALAVVALVPSERSAPVHELAVVCAAVPALLAAALAIFTLWRDEPGAKGTARLGVATLVLCAVDLALYVRHTLVPGTSTFAIPAVQKVALMFALAWMAQVALRAWRRAAR